ncbi:MAG TPA: ribonuclease H-like domain-containing protein [Magnetospirillaceae bacterium]
MAVFYHRNDLPDGTVFSNSIAVDSETMGLNLWRDRLCVIQLSGGDGNAHVVHFPDRNYAAPNLRRVLADQAITKIFHFARFDLAMIQRHFAIACAPVYCTKLASRLVRTNSDRHGLKDLCYELLGVELSKQQQTSDWGAPKLDEAQLNYAASDVLYLHALRKRLDELLEREGRKLMAEACFQFLPVRASLDLAGWPEQDIFAH